MLGGMFRDDNEYRNLTGTGMPKSKRGWVASSKGESEKRGSAVRASGPGLCKGRTDRALDLIGDVKAVQRPEEEEPGHLLALGGCKV